MLGPHEPPVTLASAETILGGPPPEMRESARLVVMDNFGILPSSHEEQIDFVDQSGYLFGPSLAATLNHVSPVLDWWNIESRCLDFESVYDCTVNVCNKLIPILINHKNIELHEKVKAQHDLLNRALDNSSSYDEDTGCKYPNSATDERQESNVADGK